MKTVPYSPFNKTYKYICLQNQVAHSKNKRKVSSSVGSNVSFLNTTNFSSNMFASNNASKVSFFEPQSIALKEKPRVIHMNKPYDSKIKNSVEKQNHRMTKKLSETKCRILTNKQSVHEYSKAKVYKDIACRYNKDSKRKDLVYFPQDSVLCSKIYSEPRSTRSFCRPNSSNIYRKY